MLNEIPEFFHPEIRQLIDFALEDAWHELRNDGLADTREACHHNRGSCSHW